MKAFSLSTRQRSNRKRFGSERRLQELSFRAITVKHGRKFRAFTRFQMFRSAQSRLIRKIQDQYLCRHDANTLSEPKGRRKTWIRRGGNLPLGNYTSILINPKNSKEIFASSALESDGGIFFSDDSGMNWKRHRFQRYENCRVAASGQWFSIRTIQIGFSPERIRQAFIELNEWFKPTTASTEGETCNSSESFTQANN